MRRARLRNLSSDAYEHPFDKNALDKLKKTPALPHATRRLYELTSDRMLLVMSMANRIRVSPRQFRALHKLFIEAKDILHVEEDVDLFVEQAYMLNAYTAGIERKQIVLTTEIIDRFTEEELLFVIGHELGHVKSEHVLYQTIARFLPILVEAIGRATLGVGQLLGLPFQLVLLDWMRKAELTADRAGLLVAQDVEVSIRALARLAGVPERFLSEISMEEIRSQAAEYEALGKDDDLNRIYQVYGQAFHSHPWLAIRMKELDVWAGEPYERIMARYGVNGNQDGFSISPHVPRPRSGSQFSPDSADVSGDTVCPSCGTHNTENALLCFGCGTPLFGTEGS